MASNEFDLLAYYKDLYEKEMEFSERLNGKITNAITLLTVIGSGHVLLIAEIFPFTSRLNFYSIATLLLCFASGCLFVWTINRFVSAYTGFEYDYFPIEDMDKTIQVAIRRKMGEEEQRVIRERLIALYREGAIKNRKTNRTKSERHLELNAAIITSFCALLIVFVTWFIFLKSQI